MTQKIDIVGLKFNHLTVIQDIGGGKVICQCDCENKTIIECYKKNVKSGRQTSCGCASRKKRVGSIEGQQFGNWIVLKELGHGKVLCQCQCENKTEKELYKKAILDGSTKSCGCLRTNNCKNTKEINGTCAGNTKYLGEKFGEWTVIGRIPNSMKLLCRCSCNTEREVYIQHLVRGESKSCGHNILNDITGKTFGNWVVIKELSNGKVLCNCLCGNAQNRILYKQTLLRGQSKSCGCMTSTYIKETLLNKYNDICTLKINNPREQWQIDTLNSKEMLEEYLKSLGEKLTIDELADRLNVTKSVISRKLHNYNLFEHVQLLYNKSYMEDDLYNYVASIYNGTIIQNDRCVLGDNTELDIYIPEKKLAIEFNGTYWHSDYFKDKEYHQRKTLLCLNKGIQLIHIFEYEWCNNSSMIQKFLHSIICKNNIEYARNLAVKEIEYDEAKNFLINNHVQGSVPSNINIALTNNDKIVGIMTFGKPRFDTNTEYEMLRLCYLHDVNVIGGSEKMFKYFIDKYNPNSIVSYCSLDKFKGRVYNRLKFITSSITEPSYVWCDKNNNVISRYQAQRHKLAEIGFKDTSMTESDIMYQLGYMRIYNSGNIKFIWNK